MAVACLVAVDLWLLWLALWLLTYGCACAADYKNTKFPPVFSAEEYASRQHRVRASMRTRGFETLVVACPANIHYLTGDHSAITTACDAFSSALSLATSACISTLAPPSTSPCRSSVTFRSCDILRFCRFKDFFPSRQRPTLFVCL